MSFGQVNNTNGWKKEQKLAEWRQIVESFKPPPQYNWWREEEKERLVTSLANKIDVGGTAYGHEMALQERELEAAAEKMMREKIDEVRAEVGQN